MRGLMPIERCIRWLRVSIDYFLQSSDNGTIGTETIISAEVMAKMQETADKAAKGIRDPEEMDRAFKEMDRVREELRKKIGTVDMALDLIRDARNQLFP